ncbi:hypothetical protein AK88_03316 [Plasmodium fragile]|uniref:tRNA(Ile)-lysidine/2-thiocytidine synthase N-terminal domain-containing protein n=1 Tax=Plasmodium fragile TaxID=5857 RepID=A0A0D9QJP0_PLAFR|nr:uncharacterized protein AK88_03316 [Plasmodium fragile]KJP87032.1 hypothetical protein AK88_03316 [Plasmodium fragile]
MYVPIFLYTWGVLYGLLYDQFAECLCRRSSPQGIFHFVSPHLGCSEGGSSHGHKKRRHHNYGERYNHGYMHTPRPSCGQRFDRPSTHRCWTSRVHLDTETQISDVLLYPEEGPNGEAQLGQRKRPALHANVKCKKKGGTSRKALFLKNICAIINEQSEERMKQLDELNTGSSNGTNALEAVRNGGNPVKKSSVAKELSLNGEVSQIVEAYWLCTLKNKYLYSFLKKKKKLIFSVSAGVDSLSLLYSFLFVVYKILVTLRYRHSHSYESLLQLLNGVYSYSHDDINEIVRCSKGDNGVKFFASVLRNVTVVYCNHATREDCTKEKNFVKNICRRHKIRFRTQVLRRKGETAEQEEASPQNQPYLKRGNNFLLLAREWRRQVYVQLTRQLEREARRERSIRGGQGGDDHNFMYADGGSMPKYSYRDYLTDVDYYIRLANRKPISEVLLRGEAPTSTPQHKLVKTPMATARACSLVKSLVFVGHHRNDNNETVLFQFLRGAFIKNLRGIKFLTAFKDCLIYRPFIKLSKINLYMYMQLLNKSWRFDTSNQSLSSSRNFIRHVVIPSISSLFEGGVPTAGNAANTANDANAAKKVNTGNNPAVRGELQSSRVYAYPTLDRKLSNIMAQTTNLDSHLQFYTNVFTIYLHNKYYYNNKANTHTQLSSNPFIKEYHIMQSKLYNSFFGSRNDQMDGLISINKVLYEQNFFLKIFNFLEFLILPSTFVRIQILHTMVRKYTGCSLTYANVDRVYNSLYQFVRSYLCNTTGDTPAVNSNMALSSLLDGKAEAQGKDKDEACTPSPKGVISSVNEKVRTIHLDGRNKILVNRIFFRIVTSGEKKEKDSEEPRPPQLREKNANVYIHDDISAQVCRINRSNVNSVINEKGTYLLIKKRRKKKREKFQIYIRYLKRNDFVHIGRKKPIKATKFLSRRGIPPVYMFSLPVVHISNFKKNNLVFLHLFGDIIQNGNFSVHQFVQMNDVQSAFVYSIRFGK